jgi:myo-inositol-1(or 4)-monophosphatase
MIDDVVNEVQRIFRHVQPLILEQAGNVTHYDTKSDGSPIADIDVKAENIIISHMTKHFPNLTVLGEETGYDDNKTTNALLVDPIDGTKSLIANIPTFTSMAVLIQNGEAVASVIHNTTTGDMYVAKQGSGAYKNGERLNLQTVALPHTAFSKARFFDVLNNMLESKRVTCETGSTGAGYAFSTIAEGASAARFNILAGGHIHDYAPGALLVREAGGSIIPVKEDSYTYKTRSFVACHPALTALIQANRQALRELEA